ncbi:MAG: YicC/YloC family endoribonuclease, partial [Bacteroidales bacterium]
MIKSMTGFGKTTLNTCGKSIIIEIRTLNSKQLDLSTRIASLFRDKENEIRTRVAKELERGKIDIAIYLDKTITSTVAIDEELAKAYYHSLLNLSETL